MCWYFIEWHESSDGYLSRVPVSRVPIYPRAQFFFVSVYDNSELRSPSWFKTFITRYTVIMIIKKLRCGDFFIF